MDISEYDSDNSIVSDSDSSDSDSYDSDSYDSLRDESLKLNWENEAGNFNKYFYFLLNLHAKGNITKNQIDFLNNSIREEIIFPILEKFKKLKNLDTVKSLATNIKHELSSLDSFYKFEKTLKELDLTEDVKKEVIECKVDRGFKKRHSINGRYKKECYTFANQISIAKIVGDSECFE